MKSSKTTLILTLLVSVLFLALFLSLANLFEIYQVSQGNTGPSDLANGIAVACAAGASILFYFSLKRRHKESLMQYFFVSLLASVSITLLYAYLVLSLSSFWYNSFHLSGSLSLNQQLLMSGLFYLFIVSLILVFAFSFFMMIKPKITYLHDLSLQVKKIEAAPGTLLEEKNNDELTDLVKSINAMSLSIQQKQEEKLKEEESRNRLIADISHDLRTPLTSMIGYLQLLKEDHFVHPDKDQEYLEVVDRRTMNLKSMIDQLFEYTKLTQTDENVHLEWVNLNSLLEYISLEYGPLYHGANLEWSLSNEAGNIQFLADHELFMRCLENLLSNARKYALPHTQIFLHVFIKEDFLCFDLSNETDLQEEHLDLLFERFYRTDTSRSNKESTGLGLPIVKRIMSLHDGKVLVFKDQERIHFTLEMPMKKEMSQEENL